MKNKENKQNKLSTFISSNKKKISMVLGGAVLTAATAGAFVFILPMVQAQNSQDTPNMSNAGNQYMEDSVVVGDIVVGVTEMGSASMNTSEVSVDFSTTILETYVKSGQYVEEGDLLALVDVSAVEESLADLYDDLEDAVLTLEQELLSAELDKMDAELNLNETLNTGENAENLYELSIIELENGLSQLVDDIYELRDKQEELEDQLDYGLDSDYGIDDYEDAIELLDAQIVELELQIAHAEECLAGDTENADDGDVSENTDPADEDGADPADEGGTDPDATPDETDTENTDDECTNPDYSHDPDALKEELATLSATRAETQKKLDDAEDSYYDAYEKLEEDLESTLDSLEEKYNSRDNYLITMESKQMEADADYATNLYNYENAQTEYENTLSKIDSDIEAQQKKVSDLQEEIAEQQALMTDGKLLAPCEGYVMSIYDAGTDRSAGAAIATLGDSGGVEVLVSIAQEDIADIEIGMDVNVLFDAYEDIPVAATVDSISMTPSGGMTSTINYVVYIMVDLEQYPDLVVFDGMTADVTFVQKQVNDVLIVSNKVVINNDGKQYVKKLDESGNIVEVEIKTGFSDGFDTEVTEGLVEGDIVILESAVMSGAA